jgi:hypothetical protein
MIRYCMLSFFVDMNELSVSRIYPSLNELKIVTIELKIGLIELKICVINYTYL